MDLEKTRTRAHDDNDLDRNGHSSLLLLAPLGSLVCPTN